MDWAEAGVGGAVLLGGLAGIGLGSVILNKTSGSTKPFDPDADRGTLSRVTLDKEGVFIEHFAPNPAPIPKKGDVPEGPVKCAMHLLKNGNVRIWSPGDVEVYGEKKMHFQTGGKMILQADEVVVDTPKFSGRASNALNTRTKPEVPIRWLAGGFKHHKIPKYTPPLGKLAKAAKWIAGKVGL
jgi:hypothetical protein